MPVYCFRDDDTNDVKEIWAQVSEIAGLQDEDGFLKEDPRFRRDFAMEQGGRGCFDQNWPKKSWALGVGTDQADEAYRESVAAGVPTEFCKETGDAIFRTKKHRDEYMKKFGFHDRSAWS